MLYFAIKSCLLLNYLYNKQSFLLIWQHVISIFFRHSYKSKPESCSVCFVLYLFNTSTAWLRPGGCFLVTKLVIQNILRLYLMHHKPPYLHLTNVFFNNLNYKKILHIGIIFEVL